MLGGDGKADGCIGQAVGTGGLGIVDVVDVDEATRPLHRRLWEVKLVPVLIDVTECRYLDGEAVLNVEENLFHLLRALLISSVIFFSMAAVSFGSSPMN